MVGLYKKQPVRLAAHFVTDEAEAELADRHDRLVELEDREGVRTIQSYTKEVRTTVFLCACACAVARVLTRACRCVCVLCVCRVVCRCDWRSRS
jgi:hypothetical protein